MTAIVLLILAGACMVGDARFPQHTIHVRNLLGYLITPVQWVVATPLQVVDWADESTTSRSTLLEENERLKHEQLILSQKVQQMVSLRAENNRLRDLLSASEKLDDKVLAAEVIGVDPDPYTHHVIINRGASSGVFKGQPVLDESGLMGQVIEVLPYTSRVILIADSNHAIPVQVSRNGVRAIAVGTGKIDEIELIYVPYTADIQDGDVLVSSGLGQRFPEGYPVAVVNKVTHEPGEAFAIVKATPSGALDRSRHVLLVFSQQHITPPEWGDKP
jgi:rod shape-determining protein MreC